MPSWFSFLAHSGELCGGIYYRVGRCDHHLYCNITGASYKDPVGRCAPMQRSGRYVDTRGFQRHIIPGAPSGHRPKKTGFYVSRESAYMRIIQDLANVSNHVHNTTDLTLSHVSNTRGTMHLSLNSSTDLGKGKIQISFSLLIQGSVEGELYPKIELFLSKS